MIPIGVEVGQSQEAASPGAADVQMDRLLWSRKQRFGAGELQWQLEKAAERIDVLTQGFESVFLWTGVVLQQSPAGGVTMQMSGPSHRSDFTVAERPCHWQLRHHLSGQ